MLAKRGFASVRIADIAREAGVARMLVYRYFGGIRSLLHEFASRSAFWPDVTELIGPDAARMDEMTMAEMATVVLQGHLRELRRRPLTQEIMRWELTERNALTKDLAEAREAQGNVIAPALPGAPGDLDVQAAGAILHAGLTYLVLRSKTADAYFGVDLRTEEGWKRIEKALAGLVKAQVDKAETGAPYSGSRASCAAIISVLPRTRHRRSRRREKPPRALRAAAELL